MNDREAYEADWDAAMRRADQLIEDHPHLEPDIIIAALDDEFCGSSILPSGDSQLVHTIELMHKESNRLRFSEIVADLDLTM
jgi:hypothetical protein